MKIAIVCYPTFGGSGVVATELGKALSRTKGHEVHFVTYSHPVRLEELSANIHFHEVDVPQYALFRYQPYELALSSKLVEVIQKYQIELLHVHYAIPHAYAAYMARKMLEDLGMSIPIVTTLHGTDITLVGKSQLYKPAVTFSINHSDAVTAVSNSLKEETFQLFNLNQTIEVIPNFIDIKKGLDHQIKCDRRMIESDVNKKIITHISNFRPLKRVIDVIKIFQKVKEQLSVKLLMVGDGPDRKKAYQYCKNRNLLNDVMFLGQSSEIQRILCLSDLFLLPSESESFGLAALEAMLYKVPVVSTNVGGLPEVNQHEFSGLTFPVGDIDGMAQGALAILSNPHNHKTYKDQAFENAKRFDVTHVIKAYEKVYQNVLMKVHQPA
ncbi:MAG: N-acetyl-alpha-D-glucosaminyl L-malate synthase BshA [Flavobacteriaceae bacterium]|nr:N-acetyl-alpha-D-glucosaminyl L-malate synthase BshA [Flavobacteriaceae bacterium]MCY4266483.1 N-acetyl-alpha-D-glucosaminyl L-malate synthase BshA [Flavobacteriaceae bacterium]